MEKELATKVFTLEDYISKENMDEQIKKYMYMLKIKFPSAIITKEFYNGNNILVRATEINNYAKKDNKDELEREEIRIKEKGINGLGENVYRDKGNERERGGR